MLNVLAAILLASLASTSAHEVGNVVHNIQKRQATGGIAVCSSFLSVDSSCSARITGFSSLAFSSQLNCYCSQGTTSYVGPLFDGYLSSCVSYFSTASPSFYSASLSGQIPSTPCQAAAARTSVSTPTVTGFQACSTWQSIYNSCGSSVSSFSSLVISAQASCLCYSSNVWQPQVYDAYWGNCLAYYSTNSPSFYSSIASGGLVTTPCRSVGNVRLGQASTPTSTGSSPTSVTNIGITTVFVNATNTGNIPGGSGSDSGDSGLSTGAKAGIGAGIGAAALIAIGAGAFFISKRKQRSKKEKEAAAAAAAAAASAASHHNSGPPPVQDQKHMSYNTTNYSGAPGPNSYNATGYNDAPGPNSYNMPPHGGNLAPNGAYGAAPGYTQTPAMSELGSPVATHTSYQSYQPYQPGSDYQTGTSTISSPTATHTSYQPYQPDYKGASNMGATSQGPVELPSEYVMHHAPGSPQPGFSSPHMPASELDSVSQAGTTTGTATGAGTGTGTGTGTAPGAGRSVN